LTPPPPHPAHAFAAALDADDFATTASLLAPDVAYHLGDRVLRGPEAVVASYAESAAWGAANLDSVGYESAVHLARGRAVITFTDHLLLGPNQHTYRCEQYLTLDDSQPPRIANVTHRELPGEREALTAWFALVGVSRR